MKKEVIVKNRDKFQIGDYIWFSDKSKNVEYVSFGDEEVSRTCNLVGEVVSIGRDNCYIRFADGEIRLCVNDGFRVATKEEYLENKYKQMLAAL